MDENKSLFDRFKEHYKSDKKFAEKVRKTRSKEELIALMKNDGYELSKNDEEIIENARNTIINRIDKLIDDELDDVVGGIRGDTGDGTKAPL